MSHVATMSVFRASTDPTQVDAHIVSVIRRTLLAGIALVLLLPAARGDSQWFGWMPLWLVGMPLSALWAAHGLRLLRRDVVAAGVTANRRRRRPQARRRTMRAAPARLPHAA